ncbi:hypothetical protein H206_05578 [Candidatus Electrothrix aarhusensis]|uniref:Uncharacterized protein n=1 Tax=Candidatus Electrothrix aarhusensis TaxID=1859131 RepID=A0A444J426_9BACT|nr:hypothetical protein H206_05578 [Candidatus Electrothrix aarhusensis]
MAWATICTFAFNRRKTSICSLSRTIRSLPYSSRVIMR